MYAYQRQPVPERRLHVVPDRQVQRPLPNRIKKKKAKKRVNPIVEMFRMFVVFSLLLSYAYLVFPTVYHRLTRQVFYPQKVPVTTETPKGAAYKDFTPYSEVDLYSVMYPLTNYVHNDLFKNRLMLTPVMKKNHSEVTTMYHTDELTGLKSQIKKLMAEYPMIKPSIYVWEYENGRYLDINADKLYPAASIIKLPVLVRMFKSIEAKQFTIYDDMTLTNYYKSSGSGNLQYAASGNKYTMDQLAKVMIQDSDNTSTNMIMAKMGGMDDVNAGLRDWGISSTYVRTWLPDLEGTNKTTASDMAKILYNLDNPGFLNINSREYIIDYMSHVKNNRLIAAGLGDGAMFIHKTGDIGTMLGDAGIVYAPNGKKYIVVILAMRPHNAYQGKDFIVKASNLIYKAIVG